jgi:hypothetical protein
MVYYSTSLIITELHPNAGLKEVIVKSPTTMVENESCAVTLAEIGIADNGLLIVDEYCQTTANSVVISGKPTTLVLDGVLTISSTLSSSGKARIYRIVGRSA